MTIGTTIRRPFELGLTRLGMLFVPRLSRRGVVRLAALFGNAAYYLAAHLRRVGLANLDIAYGDRISRKEKRSLLKQSFRTFALVILDTFWFSRDTAFRISDYVRFDDSFSRILNPKAQVCVTAHMGNWEVMGQAVTFKGYSLTSVAAPLANPAVDELFNRIRTVTGQAIVPQKGAVRRLIQALRDGGKVALVLDQNTKPSRGGIFIDFLGLEVPVSTAPATLALHTRVEICLGFCVPQPDGTYHAWAHEPIQPPAGASGPRDAAVRALTERISANVKDEILRHPGNWLWTYKRWKYVAPRRRRGEYPFYAKELLPEERRAMKE
ncbi:MAG: lysophospholipid acyltransferase family protein [Kiritimatiellae bacterium]|nr:lysophospholipid acyltransferase family protein [Kiritimatiellia bacterium]